METLIVYGTRYGSTADTAQRIAETLRKKGFNVEVTDLNKEKIEDISKYRLIIVGSGIRISKWHIKAQKFLKKHQKKLRGKKVALFVSAGQWPVEQKKGEPGVKEIAFENYLQKKAEKYSLNPVAMGLFGGIIDFNKMNWITRKFLGKIKKELKQTGFKEKNNAYDTRNLEEIDKWAEKLAKAVKKTV